MWAGSIGGICDQVETGITRVFVFVDLDSARRIKKPSWLPAAESSISWRIRKDLVVDVFAILQDRICSLLPNLISHPRAQVISTRVYHGWHRGTTATDDYRLWVEARNSFSIHKTNRISYLPDIGFGNELMCGGSRSLLYDTLRKGDDGVDRQKMVDSSLVADILQLSRSESANFSRERKPSVLSLVVADDDDLIPGVIAAEAWGMPTRIIRVGRTSESSFLNLKNMVERL